MAVEANSRRNFGGRQDEEREKSGTELKNGAHKEVEKVRDLVPLD